MSIKILLKKLCKHRQVGPSVRLSDSVGLEEELRYRFQVSPTVTLMLRTGTPLENHCFLRVYAAHGGNTQKIMMSVPYLLRWSLGWENVV